MRIAREARGWTQAELAARLKVSQGTISFWENGIEVPSLEHQVRLVEALPEILTDLAAQELGLLDRVQALERAVFSGKCGCEGCNCSAETPVTPVSVAARQGES
ncbi:MAG: helix-turn-helix transcriptional regulator [Anaerolineales bacterium]